MGNFDRRIDRVTKSHNRDVKSVRVILETHNLMLLINKGGKISFFSQIIQVLILIQGKDCKKSPNLVAITCKIRSILMNIPKIEGIYVKFKIKQS
jgi:hypothetical protein